MLYVSISMNMISKVYHYIVLLQSIMNVNRNVKRSKPITLISQLALHPVAMATESTQLASLAI